MGVVDFNHFRLEQTHKKLLTGGSLKRMLHLLTSQISFRSSSSQKFNDNTQNLSTTAFNENNFTLEENVEWIKFCKCTYKASKTLEDTDKPLLTKLEKLMPHWTSKSSDKVVYACNC